MTSGEIDVKKWQPNLTRHICCRYGFYPQTEILQPGDENHTSVSEGRLRIEAQLGIYTNAHR